MHRRYLALVRDWQVEPAGELGAWQLLDVCPRAGVCSAVAWQIDPLPLWHRTVTVEQVFVQQDSLGRYEWYLATARGQVWRGDLAGQDERLPSLTRCFVFCDAALAPDRPGSPPYLLAAGRVYRYVKGPWWRRWWQ
jgi:hypothetical protein